MAALLARSREGTVVFTFDSLGHGQWKGRGLNDRWTREPQKASWEFPLSLVNQGHEPLQTESSILDLPPSGLADLKRPRGWAMHKLGARTRMLDSHKGLVLEFRVLVDMLCVCVAAERGTQASIPALSHSA